MRSMTGYGRASVALSGGSVAVQVSSVNRRNLDVTVKVPSEWESLEPEITGRVRVVAARGKIHVDVEFTAAPSREEPGWNTAAIGEALDRLADLADGRRIPFQPTPELLWQVANAHKAAARTLSSDSARTVLLGALDEALAAFAAMRGKEGEVLRVELEERIGTCRRHLAAVSERAPAVAPAYRALLLKRLRDSGLELNPEDERVLREIALYADRCDISEEITRFRSHLDQLAELLRSQEEVGRKADFILQELGREANTMGSKANDLGISKSVIELKNELERVREQMANIE